MNEKTIRICLGLHISKCAGTTLTTSLRRLLTEDEYYFCSSFYENFLSTRPIFSEIRERERLRLYFGHYCHENLLRVFEHRNILLFTGLRDPIERALSEFRQINSAHAIAGRAPMTPAEYLAEHSNSMCGEILRCFPTIANQGNRPAWEKAREALSMMDYVYATKNFDEHAKWIFEALDVKGEISDDNLSDQREESEISREMTRQLSEILEKDPRQWFDDDINLYDVFFPYFGLRHARFEFLNHSWSIDRKKYIDGLPKYDEALRELAELEDKYFVHEFELLGKLEFLAETLRSEVEQRGKILRIIESYTSG